MIRSLRFVCSCVPCLCHLTRTRVVSHFSSRQGSKGQSPWGTKSKSQKQSKTKSVTVPHYLVKCFTVTFPVVRATPPPPLLLPLLLLLLVQQARALETPVETLESCCCCCATLVQRKK